MARDKRFNTGDIVKVVLDIPQGHFVNFYRALYYSFEFLSGTLKPEIINAKWAKIELADKSDITILKLQGKLKKNDLKKEILNKFETEFGHQGQSIISKLTGNTLQRVISVLQDIDDSKLKKCLPKEIWDEVTIQKPSLELVLSAIKMKRIDPAKIADAIETKEVDKLIVRKGK